MHWKGKRVAGGCRRNVQSLGDDDDDDDDGRKALAAWLLIMIPWPLFSPSLRIPFSLSALVCASSTLAHSLTHTLTQTRRPT